MSSMNYKYDSIEVGDYLIAKSRSNGNEINTTQLMKLMYMFYGLYIAKYDEKPFGEEPKLWPYGPVFPTAKNKCNFEESALPELDNDYIVMLDDISSKYSQFSASALSNWSHKEGGPWDTMVRRNDKWSTTMDEDLIRSYFKQFTSGA